MNIIDFHTHIFTDSLAGRAVEKLSKNHEIAYYVNGTLSDLLASMKEAGINKSVVLPVATKPTQVNTINQWLLTLPEEIIPFGAIHPECDNLAEVVDFLCQHHIKGVKLHPEYLPLSINDQAYAPMFDMLFEAGLMATLHAGIDLYYGAPAKCPPEEIQKLALKYPHGKIIAAHMGGHLQWKSAAELLLPLKNVYFDTAYCHNMPQEDFDCFLRNAPDRVLFATDSPWAPQREYVTRMQSMIEDKQLLEDVFCRNGQRLLGIC